VPRLVSLDIGADMFDADTTQGKWQTNTRLEALLQPLNQLGTVDAEAKAARDLFYTVENLRKRGGTEDQD
jgi:hypothetical protein